MITRKKNRQYQHVVNQPVPCLWVGFCCWRTNGVNWN